MNILTFDIEDWYLSNPLPENADWNTYEVRIYEGVERILTSLEERRLKGTFFCLGWIAEKHPQVIRDICNHGHHIGCHSYRHELVFHFNKNEFRADTERAKKHIEDLTGEAVNVYRAPFFSIMNENKWALEILIDLDFEYDCSIFPASRDYGGFSDYGKAKPAVFQNADGRKLKEFPINTHPFIGKNLVFSGGGYFRILPYSLIKRWTRQASYVMTYFHPRDFDPAQPMLDNIPLHRKFKSYVGLNNSFTKFKNLLSDFEFINIIEADRQINWDSVKHITLCK
jgi:polysaccharide deacetylase family protein (PEP-CTERM system associated)